MPRRQGRLGTPSPADPPAPRYSRSESNPDRRRTSPVRPPPDRAGNEGVPGSSPGVGSGKARVHTGSEATRRATDVSDPRGRQSLPPRRTTRRGARCRHRRRATRRCPHLRETSDHPSASRSGRALPSSVRSGCRRSPAPGLRSCPRRRGRRRSMVAPLTVAWASMLRGVPVQMPGVCAAHDRAVEQDLEWRGRRPRARRCGGSPAAAGPAPGHAIRNGSSASSGTIQGEIEVANDLPRNGPSGWYSQRWIARALQSLTSTNPKMWSARVGCGDRRAERRAVAGDEAELELDVKARLGAERRRVARLGRRPLAARAADRRAAHDDGARAAVVADGQVAPVGHQRVAVGPEHPAQVRGVLDRGIEVDVVADLDREHARSHSASGIEHCSRRPSRITCAISARAWLHAGRSEREERLSGAVLERPRRHRGPQREVRVGRSRRLRAGPPGRRVAAAPTTPYGRFSIPKPGSGTRRRFLEDAVRDQVATGSSKLQLP